MSPSCGQILDLVGPGPRLNVLLNSLNLLAAPVAAQLALDLRFGNSLFEELLHFVEVVVGPAAVVAPCRLLQRFGCWPLKKRQLVAAISGVGCRVRCLLNVRAALDLQQVFQGLNLRVPSQTQAPWAKRAIVLAARPCFIQQQIDWNKRGGCLERVWCLDGGWLVTALPVDDEGPAQQVTTRLDSWVVGPLVAGHGLQPRLKSARRRADSAALQSLSAGASASGRLLQARSAMQPRGKNNARPRLLAALAATAGLRRRGPPAPPQLLVRPQQRAGRARLLLQSASKGCGLGCAPGAGSSSPACWAASGAPQPSFPSSASWPALPRGQAALPAAESSRVWSASAVGKRGRSCSQPRGARAGCHPHFYLLLASPRPCLGHSCGLCRLWRALPFGRALQRCLAELALQVQSVALCLSQEQAAPSLLASLSSSPKHNTLAKFVKRS